MRILAALFVASPVLAQAISAGLRAGTPVTSALSTNELRHAAVAGWLVGPAVEWHWRHGIAFGADFLLRCTGLSTYPWAAGQTAIWNWELPATLMYQFRGRTKPFLRTGVSVNHVFGLSGANECGRGPSGELFYCEDSIPLAELRHRGTFGFVAGGGFRFSIRRLWLEPEMRLTRWSERNFGVRDSAVRSNLVQIAVLVGVFF